MADPESSGVLRLRDLEGRATRAEFVHPGSRLLRRRRFTALAVVAFVGGSVTFSAGYAWYLRSDFYRNRLARRIGDRLGLSVEMSDVHRIGVRGVELIEPRVSLMDGPQVLRCQSARWRFADDGVTSGFVLDLAGGWVSVGGSGWSKSRYGELLHRSLGQDFAELRVGQVRVRDVDLRFASPFGELTASATRGVVDVCGSGEAVATLNSAELNGVHVDTPVNISARFRPGAALAFSEVRLAVPQAPIAALGVAEAAADGQSQGSFDGTIRYHRDDRGDIVSLVGSVSDVNLAALTRIPGGPYRGRVTLDVRDATVRNKALATLNASGAIQRVYVADLFPSLAVDAGSATVSLAVNDIRIHDGHVDYLQVSGTCEGLSLGTLSGLIGPRRVTGTVRIDITNLLVVDDRVTAADLVVDAVAPKGEPGTIDRAVLARGAAAWLGVDIGKWLPPSVEYVRLGARVLIDGDRLRIEGTHGPDHATILTVRVFGRPFAALAAPDRDFAVPDFRAMLLERAGAVDRDDLRGWWGVLRAGPAGSGTAPDDAASPDDRD